MAAIGGKGRAGRMGRCLFLVKRLRLAVRNSLDSHRGRKPGGREPGRSKTRAVSIMDEALFRTKSGGHFPLMVALGA
jgi:hypothetical protein